MARAASSLPMLWTRGRKNGDGGSLLMSARATSKQRTETSLFWMHPAIKTSYRIWSWALHRQIAPSWYWIRILRNSRGVSMWVGLRNMPYWRGVWAWCSCVWRLISWIWWSGPSTGMRKLWEGYSLSSIRLASDRKMWVLFRYQLFMELIWLRGLIQWLRLVWHRGTRGLLSLRSLIISNSRSAVQPNPCASASTTTTSRLKGTSSVTVSKSKLILVSSRNVINYCWCPWTT